MKNQESLGNSSPFVIALARVLSTGVSESFEGSTAEQLVGELRLDISDKVGEIRRNSTPTLAFYKK